MINGDLIRRKLSRLNMYLDRLSPISKMNIWKLTTKRSLK